MFLNSTCFVTVVLMVCGLDHCGCKTWAIELCNTNTASMMEKMNIIMNTNGLEKLIIQNKLSIDICPSLVMSIILLKKYVFYYWKV